MKIKGPWDLVQIEEYLDESVLPARVGVTSPNGWPMVVSLWFLFENGSLFCATKESSRVAECLRSSNRCAFEIARDKAPYFGVRGQGTATLASENAHDLLVRLADRYLDNPDSVFRRRLLTNTANETLIRIDPVSFHCWDYRSRMAA